MVETSIKEEFYLSACYGCLSDDRQLSDLGKDFALFKHLLGLESKMNISNISLCWECMAVLRKIRRFQQRIHSIWVYLQQEDSRRQDLTCLSTLTKLTLDHDKTDILIKSYTESEESSNLSTPETINDTSEPDQPETKEESVLTVKIENVYDSLIDVEDMNMSIENLAQNLNIEQQPCNEVQLKKAPISSSSENNSDLEPKCTELRNISLQERQRIVALRKLGYNLNQIVSETGLSWRTVRRWVTRYEEEGSLTDRPRNGRPRHINQIQEKEMVQAFQSNGFLRTKDFAEKYSTSTDTVRRTLQQQGIRHRKPAKRPRLSEEHKRTRLEFAKKYLDFDWETTIFTGGKTFMSCQHGHLHLSRKNGARFDENNVIKNTECSGVSLNVWGWMSAAGSGELVAPLPGRASAADYVDILDQNMLPTVRCVYPSEEVPRISFVRDPTTVPRALVVNDWFNRNRDVSVIPWSARSRDLNPIEHVWGLMVETWERSERTEALEWHCCEVWEDLRGTDTCSKIVSSMRQRLQNVIENNGGYTRYLVTKY